MSVAIDPVFLTNEPELMIDAAVNGLGLTHAVRGEVEPHLASGRLVAVLEDWYPVRAGTFLYYPSRRQTTTVFAAVVEALRYRCSPMPQGGWPCRLPPGERLDTRGYRATGSG